METMDKNQVIAKVSSVAFDGVIASINNEYLLMKTKEALMHFPLYGIVGLGLAIDSISKKSIFRIDFLTSTATRRSCYFPIKQ